MSYSPRQIDQFKDNLVKDRNEGDELQYKHCVEEIINLIKNSACYKVAYVLRAMSILNDLSVLKVSTACNPHYILHVFHSWPQSSTFGVRETS